MAQKVLKIAPLKLMDVCRLRDTPILTFVNKMDREARDPMEVLDEIENVLHIKVAPINWPLGMGKEFKGVYNLYTDTVHVYKQGQGSTIPDDVQIKGIDNEEFSRLLGPYADDVRAELDLVRGAAHQFDLEEYLAGTLTPAFFGTALGNFGVREMLDGFVEWAPHSVGAFRCCEWCRGATQR
jgi:peptide chain release factor 3